MFCSLRIPFSPLDDTNRFTLSNNKFNLRISPHKTRVRLQTILPLIHYTLEWYSFQCIIRSRETEVVGSEVGCGDEGSELSGGRWQRVADFEGVDCED